MVKIHIHPGDAAGRGLLQQYLKRRRGELAQLREALAAANFEQIRRVGHNLLGSGAAYDLPRISMLGERLERAAEGANGTEIAAIVADLEDFLDAVVLGPAP